MRVIGGLLDGEDRNFRGIEYGIAWTFYNSEHLWRDCPIPGPPSDPSELYVRDIGRSGELVWRFVRVER